jgi:hypothetical protein
MYKPSCDELISDLREISHLKRQFDIAADNLNLKKMQEIQNEIGAPLEIHYEYARYRFAEQFMGEDFFGVADVEKTFGVKLDFEKIPAIPFTKRELLFAHECGFKLIFRQSRTSTGLPLNADDLAKRFAKAHGLHMDDISSIPNIPERFPDESFPRGWVIAGLDGPSDRCDFREQTLNLYNRAAALFYHEINTSSEIRSAIESFDIYYDDNQNLLDFNIAKDEKDPHAMSKRAINKGLASLKINKTLRPTAIELFYDMLMIRNRGYDYPDKSKLYPIFCNTLTPHDEFMTLRYLGIKNQKIDILYRDSFDKEGVGYFSWRK